MKDKLYKIGINIGVAGYILLATYCIMVDKGLDFPTLIDNLIHKLNNTMDSNQ